MNMEKTTSSHEECAPQQKAYIAISAVTELPVIMSPPGTPPITSEEVRKLLDNFP